MTISRRVLYALAVNDRVDSAVRRLPAVEARAYRSALRYVAGRSLREAIERIRSLAADGFAVSLDLFGEGARSEADVETTVHGYHEAAKALADLDADSDADVKAEVDLEIVPSHLGLDFGVNVCRRYVERLAVDLPKGSRLQVSAEEAWRTPHIIELSLALSEASVPVTATVQANLKRSEQDTDRLSEAGIPVRLVKGAYLESPSTAYTWGEHTDLAYLRIARRLGRAGSGLVLATHDPVLREAVLDSVEVEGIEMLLGVRPDDARDLVDRGHRVRIYVPYGDAWFRYWMRRVAEARG